jgi:hypothetical protein
MIRLLLAALLGLGAPALAQDQDLFRFGGDAFYGGPDVTVGAAGADDVFAAAERVEISEAISGSALLAARRVTVDAAVGGDLYAAGADITVTAPVAGDATLAGYDVGVGASIGGDLRAFGRTVRVTGPVAGTAMLRGGTVAVDNRIEGDTTISADTVEFGPGAAIGGRLVLSGPRAAAVAVPAGVAAPDRIERRPATDGAALPAPPPRSWFAVGVGFVVSALILAALTLLVATLAPAKLEAIRDHTAERPFRTFWIGFLTLATLIGASVLAVLTVIGILAAPAIILAAAVLGLLGYLVAVYLVGRAVWDWIGQLAPDELSERALVALLGAAAVSLMALVPFVGWLLLLVLSLTGLGALTTAWLRPEFRT